MIRDADRSPLALDVLRELVPLAKRVKAAHLSEDDLAVLVAFDRLPVERLVGFLPSVELNVPPLVLELVVIDMVGLGSSEGKDPPGGVLLLQLRVDVDEGFDGVRGRVGEPFELLVMQSFGKGAMLQSLEGRRDGRSACEALLLWIGSRCSTHVLAEHLRVDRQRLVVVFGKLAQIEQLVDRLGSSGVGRDGVCDRGDKILLEKREDNRNEPDRARRASSSTR
jgi:hypothetical protein